MNCSRIPLIGGNWKCNGGISVANELIAALTNGLRPEIFGYVQVFIAPPALYLTDARRMAGNMQVLSQNVSQTCVGAFTGEICAKMLLDCGVDGSLVGHSERRSLYGETSQIVAAKTVQIVRTNLRAVVCVGETLDQRESGRTLQIVLDEHMEQLRLGLLEESKLSNSEEARLWSFVDIAYEPVWAIGTGRTPTLPQIEQVHQEIRSWIGRMVSVEVSEKIRILYGGSVKASNALSIATQCPNVDGFLVGGASLKAQEFIDIIMAMHQAGRRN